MMENFDLVVLIKSVGYVGIFTAIIAENAIPFLFFLPGDTLLLTAGFLAGQGVLNIWILMGGGLITSIVGYMLGYHLGLRMGLKVLTRGDGRFIRRDHLRKTRVFYRKYGAVSLFLARFLPLRACVCFLAGMGRMNYSVFMLYNVLGAVIWGVCLPLIGYYVSDLIPIHNLKTLGFIPAFGVVIALVFVFGVGYFLKNRRLWRRVNKNIAPISASKSA